MLGNGITIKDRIKITWHEKMASPQSHDSYYKLGVLYEKYELFDLAIFAYYTGAFHSNMNALAAVERLSPLYPMAAYYLGHVHESKGKWQEAFSQYSQAANQGQSKAMFGLGKLYKSDKKTSERTIVVLKNIQTEVQWYRKAIIAGNEDALKELKDMAKSNTLTNKDRGFIFFQLGEIYQQGEGVIVGKTQALLYYKNASDLGVLDADLCVAELFREGYGGYKTDFKQACTYYLKCIRNGNVSILDRVLQFINEKQDPEQYYEVGQVYELFFNDLHTALTWYKKSADCSYQPASDRLLAIADEKAGAALLIAKLYMQEGEPSEHSLDFYLIGAKARDPAAIDELERLAMAGNSNAQYVLGYGFWFQCNGNSVEAIIWCHYAQEQGHEAAKAFLTETHFTNECYLQVAEQFERKKTYKDYLSNTFLYYVKASDLGNATASFMLGYMYEHGIHVQFKNETKACEFYLKSLTQGNRQAMASIERVLTQFQHQVIQYQYALFLENQLNDKMRSIKWYIRAHVAGLQKASSQLDKMALSNGFYAYTIGTQYEAYTQISNAMSVALSFYVRAACLGNMISVQRMKQLAMAGNVEAQYSYGFEYLYRFQLERKESFEWCVKAAEKNHMKAAAFINQTQFTAEQYFMIAQLYEQGAAIPKKIQKAIEFYSKASSSGNAQAQFRLGVCYEDFSNMHSSDASIQNRLLRKACKHYIKAIAKHYSKACAPAERLLDTLNDKDLAYALANIYHVTLKNTIDAAQWYAKAVDWGSMDALNELVGYSHSEPIFAFALAQMYEQGRGLFVNVSTSLLFYVRAALNGHVDAKNRLEYLANLGDSEAQYVLGCEYYFKKGQTLEAIKWCVLACEKSHPQASCFLTDTVFPTWLYMHLAKLYESGSLTSINMEKAMLFYQKAADTGDKEACIRAAQLYPLLSECTQGVNARIWANHAIAARQGNRSSLASLERLAEYGTTQMCNELASIYRLPLYQDEEKAQFWLQNGFNMASSQVCSAPGLYHSYKKVTVDLARNSEKPTHVPREHSVNSLYNKIATLNK